MSHSPNLDKLDQEASMQNIDRLVEALEMEAKESRMSKCRKLFSDEASNSALKPTRSNTGTTSECIIDLFAVGLRKLVDFLVKEECRRIVPPFEVEAKFLKAEWESEKGELVCEREALKEELNKAKEMAAQAEQRTEAVRLEKEALQQQYAKDKAEWESWNT
ncbi:hypothetical protein R1flu_026037 [Riccia fluitans]|uniref:Uncharacterized protein n=1 Tax=Riccia fluitans TaxID=41844 RepID=A0ABD1XET6_9MARC